MKRVKDKVAIVTGAASGMGREVAKLFAAEGAKVVATDIQQDRLETLEKEIQSTGGDVLTLTHNVTNRSDWEKVIQKAVEKFGRIDVLVNNAGVSLEKSFDKVTDEDWSRVMDINVKSIFLGCQLTMPEMIKNKKGSIINIGSMAGMVGNSGSGPYTASKGAVRAISKALAVDYAQHSIRVNAVHPGYIKTEMSQALFENEMYRGIFEANTPLPYLGDTDDIAEAVLFLASDASKFITGVDLPVDGGVIAR